MLNKLRIKWRIFLLVCILVVICGTLSAEITVSLTDACYPTGGDVSVPMEISGIDAEVIYSIYTKVTFDPAVVTLNEVSSGADLPAGAQISSNSSASGQVVIAIWGSNEIGANGVFANFAFSIIGEEGSGTDLVFDYFYFNEGSPSVTSDNGIIFYGDPDPVLANPGNMTFNENDTVAFTITAHDPLGTALVLDLTTELPTGVNWQDNSDGTGIFTWQTNYLSGGSYPLTFTATNEAMITDNISFDLIITNVLQAPVITQAIADFSFFEDTIDTSIDLNNVFTDYDLDFGDELSFSYAGNTNISISIDDGLVTLIPAEDWNGVELITFTATDNQLTTANDLVEITVLNVNDSPIVVNTISPIIMEEDGLDNSIDLNDIFYDIDGDILSYSTPGASHIAVDITDGLVTLTPEADWFGNANIIFTADDEQGGAIANTLVDITVNSVNDKPFSIGTIGPLVISVNGTLDTPALDAIFADIDSPLTYEIQNSVDISYVINPNKTVTLIPQPDWYGVENLVFVAIDDYDEEVFEVVQVTVADFKLIEDFNYSGSLADDWTIQHAGNTSTPWNPVLDSSDDYSMSVTNGIFQTSDEKLISPVYDFSAFTELEISFAHTYAHNQGTIAYFQVSNNGSTYQTLASFTANTSGRVTTSFNSASYVRFRWYFYSTINLGASWNIDDVTISGRVSDSTPPTTIRDLSVDSFTDDSISLSWTPTTEQFFDYYEVVYSTDNIINSSVDQIWTVADDSELADINTTTTTIENVTFNTHYYLAVRGVDAWSNKGNWSNLAECIIANPVTISSPYPEQSSSLISNSRTIEIGVTIQDDYLVDASTIQYRIDSNGNGMYDIEEVWTDITGYIDSAEIVVRETVTYNTDGEALAFEFRAQDVISSPLTYSGTVSSEGISDDYILMIDTLPPSTVSDFYVVSAAVNTVTLSWTPATELNFAGYEVFYSQIAGVTNSDSSWSSLNDADLINISTNTTTITGLIPGEMYYFILQSIDHAGNTSDLSNEVTSVPPSDLPTCSLPFPEIPTLGNSRTVTVGCTFEDYFGIDDTTIQYRFDANGNGIYDAEEVWTDYIGRNTSIEVRADITYEVDGEMLPFEFRAWDIDGFGPVYSGMNSTEGISDDWFVMIDSTSPTDISTTVAYSNGSESITVYWTSSSDSHFFGYEIYYSDQSGVTTDDDVWNWNNDPAMNNLGEGFSSTNVAGLNPGTTYYFRVRAIDSAGNASNLSEMEATNTTEGSFLPSIPTDLIIIATDADMILSWSPVTTNTNGDPITVTNYDVYSASNPDFIAGNDTKITSDDGDNDATNASFTHAGILNFDDTRYLFYKVTANYTINSPAKSNRESFLEFLSRKNNLKEAK